jgi:hypothetical protein
VVIDLEVAFGVNSLLVRSESVTSCGGDVAWVNRGAADREEVTFAAGTELANREVVAPGARFYEPVSTVIYVLIWSNLI